MNNKLLVFSSSVLATGVLLGASNGSGGYNTAHADTINNNMNNMNQKDMSMNHNMDNMNGNMNQKDMSMNHNMDNMNGNMNQKDMSMNHNMDNMNGNMNQKDMSMNHNMDNMNQQAMMPYYNYTGYTTYDGDFTQDYNFVRALKHDNVMIDGYKVNTAAADKDVATSKKLDDTMVDMNKDGQVVHITFDTKKHVVSKDMFKKEHMSNHMSDEGQIENGSYMTYETNNGMYKAFFDKQGYLMKVMIS
ncbi:hypothetical protein K2V75_13725 [Staphylococcus gallinarum]|uniref:immunodominant staphylococcal antigen IsaB family protein n=1 Tax=Staphylococcus TaxID=1279 RepID=UPI000597E285|nr:MULTISPECIES: hypothetical protein [Staphylococcus]KIJ85737.1 hypothetical protein SE00_13075 [Staphylococcus saprophyticus]MCD8911183.1 hypothetical protein [Staphylococcus gallinarum]QKQ06606.1 hypothetical protein HSZ49_12615 [Staphylococcus saprophyticus]SUM76662.1 immunodominant antigen B [Staphylococcus saprophyticus]